jgi:serine-type D-Ala-D-Ala carboxypeptidase/endopeptidase (penicillin-binding protein 4)
VREGPAPTDHPPSFVFESRPLADTVRDINKFSNNVMAQQLFLTLGLMQAGAGTPEAAREVMGRFAQERTACQAPELVIDNGSGLSRSARSSAACLASLLQSAWGSPVMPELLASLPVAGLDGTARKGRELGPAQGRAHLKTGTLDDSTGLAGIVLGQSGRRYVFVAMVNHPRAGAARTALESLVQWTAQD